MKKELGTLGEDYAACYLQSCGAEILEHNYWCRFGEIDLIAQYADQLIFVEVKTRQNCHFDYPEEVLSNHKILRMRRCIGHYLSERHPSFLSLRIDLIYLLVNSEHMLQSLQHLKDI